MPLPAAQFTNVVGTPATPQFFRLTINGHTLESNGTSKPHVNIMDFRTILPNPGDTETNLITAWNAGVGGVYLAAMTDDYTLDNYLGRFMDNPANAGTTINSGAVGAIATDRAASFTAVVFQKKSGLSGRNYRGSMHMGAVAEASTTKDGLSAGGLVIYTAVLTALQALLVGINGGVNTWYPCIQSMDPDLSDWMANPRRFGGANITNFTLNSKQGTMKRRKEK